MRAKIIAHRLPIIGLSQPLLEHAQYRRSLLIGDAVESGLNIVVAQYRLGGLARRKQAVAAHRTERALKPAEIPLKIRLQIHGGLALCPGGERLVEPDVVPPGDGNEVAEPLMGDLMGIDVEAGAIGGGRRVGVDAQKRVAEYDQTGIFHGTGTEVRSAEQIQLVEGIRLLSVVLVIGDDRWSLLQNPFELGAGAGRRDAAQRRRLLAD